MSNNEIIITKQVIRSGDSIILVIPKDVSTLLDLAPGNIVEAKLRKIV